jgi:hypothetical protein
VADDPAAIFAAGTTARVYGFAADRLGQRLDSTVSGAGRRRGEGRAGVR